MLPEDIKKRFLNTSENYNCLGRRTRGVTSIPACQDTYVPKRLHTFGVSNLYYICLLSYVERDVFIYMQYVRGETLRARWDSLSIANKTSVCDHLRQIMTSLRQVKQDLNDSFVSKLRNS